MTQLAQNAEILIYRRETQKTCESAEEWVNYGIVVEDSGPLCAIHTNFWPICDLAVFIWKLAIVVGVTHSERFVLVVETLSIVVKVPV